MTANEGEGKGFKVVDKRRFTSEGEARPGAPEDRPAPAKQAAAPAQPKRGGEPAQAQAQAQRAQQPAPPPQAGGIDFLSFVASLATNALAAMGALPNQPPNMPIDPQLAREFIEILGLLKDKTRGNLTQQEAAGLERILTDLRMQFVEFSRGAAKPKR